MKYILSILIICNCLNCQPLQSKAAAHWGYIHYIARLSSSYLNHNIPRYSVICLSGFTITARGSISVHRNATFKKTVTISKKHKTTLYALITFKNIYSGIHVFKSKSSQIRFWKHLSTLIRRYKLKGIQFDFEYFTANYTAQLVAFLAETRRAFPGLHISMALFPKIDFPVKWSAFHNYKMIAAHIDSAVIMCYDYHRNHTSPGPVTSVAWAKKNIQYTLQFFKANKVWLGIPAYGYKWKDGSSRATVISNRGLQYIRQNAVCKRHHSQTLNCCYSHKGNTYNIYISDNYTRNKLYKLASDFKLKGTAMWRLGFE